MTTGAAEYEYHHYSLIIIVIARRLLAKFMDYLLGEVGPQNNREVMVADSVNGS